MKNFIIAIFAVFMFTALKAQEDNTIKIKPKFGVKAGYTFVDLKVSVDGNSESDDVSGFYIGAFVDFFISEKFNVQPELNYANYSEDGESSGVLLLPVLAKFKVDDKFSIHAGPQLDYLLNEEDAEGLKRAGIGFALGAAYNISENIFIDARYTFGLSDRWDADDFLDDLVGSSDFDVKAKFNYFQIGLGYKF